MKTSIFKKGESKIDDNKEYLENRKNKDYLIARISSAYVESDYESITGSVYTVFLIIAAIVFILKVVSFPPKWWIAVLYFIAFFVAAYIVSSLIWLALDKHKKARKEKVRKVLETMTAAELKDERFQKKYHIDSYGERARIALNDLIALKEAENRQ